MIGLCELGDDGVEAADHFTRGGAVRSDSMGLESILYFPRLPWTELNSEDDMHSEGVPTSDQG